jgi:hypothetical protein
MRVAGARTGRLLLALLTLAGCGGCSLLGELLHMRPVEIVDFSPNQELVEASQVASVRVRFSTAMARAVTEAAFSLEREGEGLDGRFSWRESDCLLEFTPSAPLLARSEYLLSVGTSAEDGYGNSLAEPFAFRFYTAEERGRPRLLSHSPADGEEVAQPREPVRVRFSEPIDAGSFYEGFSLSPELPGAFSWSPQGEEVQFLPLSDYREGVAYTATLRQSITDRSGNGLEQEYSFRFRLREEAPIEVLSVLAVGAGKSLPPASEGGLLDPSLGIEKDEQFLITFSAPVPLGKRAGVVEVEPSAPFSLDWESPGGACTLCFADRLGWGQLYSLGVLGESYTFLVNGPGSLPITVEAIRYCPDINASPGPPSFLTLRFADNVDFTGALNPVFDLHLRHAEAAQIDLGSFLRAFSLSISGGCIELDALEVEGSPLAVDPDPPPAAGQSVLRLYCEIDDPPLSGTVTFTVRRELRDSLDNHLQQEYALLINN